MSGSEVEQLRGRLQAAERAQMELERRMYHLKTLYEVSRELAPLTDTASILNTALLMVMGTLGACSGCILLYDSRTRSTQALSSRGMEPCAQARLVRELETCGDEALELAQGLSALGLSVCVPFGVCENVKGAICLGSRLTEEGYSDDDGQLLATLAHQAAAAVQRARAHEEVVRYSRELESSLHRIRALESMKASLMNFVPRTVRRLIEASPHAPSLDKRDTDVSVLFADIAGYSKLSSALDMERVNQLVEVYFGDFLDEILQHGGDVNETAGDGLMVIFHDDDPHRHAMAAVRAALGIQRRTQRTNETLEGFFEPVAVHVGINSGVAAVGVTRIEGVAGVRWTYTASGPTTNVAARLASVCEGGGVVISEETRRRLGEGFDVSDMGLLALKNIAHPVRSFKVHMPTDQ